ncbi:restriction endonuclease subunit S [Erythrobacter sp. A6_0]|uniref:restriction endonuclease subunit S n=1 Tax=Erythrobacter sp. A6_0 TaxID=2821089 RepID=UPI001ADBE37B|nr:restriction endonuclease subunit S [Erythrobacter sp. A6_0]
MSWDAAPLSSVSKTFADGDWVESKDQAEDGIRLVQTGNVGVGRFKDRRDKARWISSQTFHRLNCTEVLPGDVLVSRLPDPVGRACLVPETGDRMITAVDCTIVRPDVGTLDREFLVYYTQSKTYQRDIEGRCTGTTRKRISRKNLGLIPIPLPPLEEQKRIVAVLDQAFSALDRARANAEANLADADGMVQIEIDRAFAELAEQYDQRSFEDITKTTLIGLVRSKREQPETGEFAYVKMNHISNDNRFINEILDRVNCEPNEFPRFQIRVGDFLFNTRNSRELVGKSCVVNSAIPDKTVFNNNLMRARFSDEVNPQFVAFGFRSTLGQRQLEEMKSGTTNVVAIYHKSLKGMKLPIPIVDIQNATVRTLSALEEKVLLLKDYYENTLTDLEDLRRSILTKAFAGELT